MARRTLITAVFALLLGWCVACDEPRRDSRIQASYDERGKLRLLTYDSQGTGKPDTWSYMDGSTIVRIDRDTDGDGVIDRREFYGPDDHVRVEFSTRDGHVRRTEFFVAGALVSAEEDTAGTGHVNKWETYANGVMRSVAFDLDGAGRPTRRLLYDDKGQVKGGTR